MTIDTAEFAAISAHLDGLAGQVADLGERVQQATAAEEILRRSSAPVLPFPAGTGARHVRPRHLRLLPGGQR